MDFKWAAAVGFLLGAISSWLWVALGRWCSDTEFWKSVLEIPRRLLIAKPEEFWPIYRTLCHNLVRYLGTLAFRVSISIAPIVLIVTWIAPFASEYQYRHASSIQVYPRQPVNVYVADYATRSDDHGEFPRTPILEDHPGVIAAVDWSVKVPEWRSPCGVSRHWGTRLGMLLCGIHVIPAQGNSPEWFIVRPTNLDRNPCWPYLSDFEIVFWLSLVGGSLAVAIMARRVNRLGERRAILGREATVQYVRASSGDTGLSRD